MRVPFLALALVCALLGAATAAWTSRGVVNPQYFALVLIGAVAAHISVNALNEYFDFKSGLDLRTQRTPFSGGSGTLPARPELARSALLTGVITLVITGAVGLYFLYVWGLALLPLGLLGLITIVIYTVWLTRNPVLCLLTPGLGFGTLMVMGTDFVLTGQYSWTAFVASLVPFFLVNNLLLLNQFPDVEADRSIGRKHFPIVIGRRASSLVYAAFMLFTYVSIVLGVYLGLLPLAALLGLLGLVLAVPACVGAYRYADDVGKLVPYLALNVLVNLITPMLVAVGLFIGPN
ncbi:MAG: prenyltransferase [Chloroflexi bacterium]|nr:prenyltransferase [Chloroflexota bacterium]MBU1749080.1 prenyltransferase [Chloroflexota bacterium]